MDRCSYCGKEIKGLPFKCSRCTGEYCSKHRLPEDHECPGLKKEKAGNKERWQKAFTKTFPNVKQQSKQVKSTKTDKKYDKNKIKEETSKHTKNKLSRKLKYYIQYKTESFWDWLIEREHHQYNIKRRFNYLLEIFIPLFISIVAYNIFYTNANKLNEINLWIIKLGGVLILVSLFFIVKYGLKCIKELINILKRQRNWMRCLFIILIVFLLWQGYTQRDTILNPVFDIYKDTNFSLYSPFSALNLSSTNGTSDNEIPVLSDIKEIITPGSRDVAVIEQKILPLVNTERAKYGKRALSRKANLDSFARAWSDKMISAGFFEHSDLNFYFSSIAGENIGETPIHYNVVGCGSTYTNEAMADCFVEGWIGSPGHHENMIDGRFYLTGIGVSCDSSKCRATQVFSG